MEALQTCMHIIRWYLNVVFAPMNLLPCLDIRLPDFSFLLMISANTCSDLPLHHVLRLFFQAEGPVAVDALLTRVFSLATHPDKNRRLGGLMAFNQLCRPLREETSLLDR